MGCSSMAKQGGEDDGVSLVSMKLNWCLKLSLLYPALSTWLAVAPPLLPTMKPGFYYTSRSRQFCFATYLACQGLFLEVNGKQRGSLARAAAVQASGEASTRPCLRGVHQLKIAGANGAANNFDWRM